MSKPSRKPRKPEQFRTLAEFSTGLKVPVSTLSGWIRHDFWQWSKKAPWPKSVVPDVLRAAADNLERGRPPTEKTDPRAAQNTKDLREEKLRQEIRKLRAHADQAETALAKERGTLHDADACEEEAVRRATLYRNAVQNVPTQVVSLALAHGMPHEAAPTFQKQLEELVNGCLRYTAASAEPAASDPMPTPCDGPSASSPPATGAVDALAVG
jgi:hypothetical protein